MLLNSFANLIAFILVYFFNLPQTTGKCNQSSYNEFNQILYDSFQWIILSSTIITHKAWVNYLKGPFSNLCLLCYTSLHWTYHY